LPTDYIVFNQESAPLTLHNLKPIERIVLEPPEEASFAADRELVAC
jgi:hypothetical protein